MSRTANRRLATRFNTVITHLSRTIRRIDDKQEIGRARLSALSVLVFGGPRTMTELARDEMVSAATMHHVVNGLLELKFADKRPDKDDARKSVITATKSGHAFMEEARRARLDFYCEKLDLLNAKEREIVSEFVRVASEWTVRQRD